jgi:Mg-chelatase subunit ChlD
MVGKRFGIILLTLFALAQVAAQVRPSSADVTLSQLSLGGERVVLYVDFFRARAEGLSVAPESLSVTVGNTRPSIGNVTPFEETGEGVAFVLVVDVSRSLRPAEFELVREGLAEWVSSANEQDRFSLITVGNEVEVRSHFADVRGSVLEAVRGLELTGNSTRLYDGLREAVEVAQSPGARNPLRRAIVVVSDGIDDAVGGTTRAEVVDAVSAVGIPTFAIGYYSPPASESTLEGLASLGEIARRSGGELFYPEGLAPSELMLAAVARIKAVEVIELKCDKCPADGGEHRVQVTLQNGSESHSAGRSYLFLPIDGEEPSPLAWLWVLLPALAVGLVLFWRKRHMSGDGAEGEMTENLKEAPPTLDPATSQHVIPDLVALFEPIGESDIAPLARIELRGSASVGRAESCDVSVPTDSLLSGLHCRLLVSEGLLLIEDADSTNGTRVNGIAVIGRRRLDPGDVLAIGSIEARLREVRWT